MVDMITFNISLECLNITKGCLCNLSHLIRPQLWEVDYDPHFKFKANFFGAFDPPKMKLAS